MPVTRSSPSPEQRFVVIPSFDQPEQTTRCVRNLLRQAEDDLTVLVVDHGHADWTPPSTLTSDRFTILKAHTDLWWAGATNVGIRYALAAGAGAVMLLNADCVLDVGTAHRLFEVAETHTWVVAPIQRAITTRSVVCAGAFPLLTLGFPILRERTATGGLADAHTIICGGRGVVIPAAVFNEVGLLAEDELPHYGADHDFFLRCRRAGIHQTVIGDLDVLVDETRTSTATKPRALTWTEFRASLSDPRSHRNLPAVRVFFRRNYPNPRLHRIGPVLFLLRYTLSWGIRRAIGVFRRRS